MGMLSLGQESDIVTGDATAYYVFVSTFLHRNLISDLRNRCPYKYYRDRYENVVDRLKILPLVTAELQTILSREVNYDTLYPLFDAAYRLDESVPTWCEREMAGKL
jgi:hypothetical protein